MMQGLGSKVKGRHKEVELMNIGRPWTAGTHGHEGILREAYRHPGPDIPV